MLSARMVHPTCARIFLHNNPRPGEETKLVLGPFPLGLAGVVRPAWGPFGFGTHNKLQRGRQMVPWYDAVLDKAKKAWVALLQTTVRQREKSPGHASVRNLGANKLSSIQRGRRGVETGLTIPGWRWR